MNRAIIGTTIDVCHNEELWCWYLLDTKTDLVSRESYVTADQARAAFFDDTVEWTH